jgi:hypothetical protein
VTAREALAEVEALGFHLALRPGGLRLKGKGEPPPELLGMIRDHRDGLLALLEEDARLWAAHEASLAAGRVVPFPAHLLGYVHPSIRHLVAGGGAAGGSESDHEVDHKTTYFQQEILEKRSI